MPENAEKSRSENATLSASKCEKVRKNPIFGKNNRVPPMGARKPLKSDAGFVAKKLRKIPFFTRKTPILGPENPEFRPSMPKHRSKELERALKCAKCAQKTRKSCESCKTREKCGKCQLRNTVPAASKRIKHRNPGIPWGAPGGPLKTAKYRCRKSGKK